MFPKIRHDLMAVAKITRSALLRCGRLVFYELARFRSFMNEQIVEVVIVCGICLRANMPGSSQDVLCP